MFLFDLGNYVKLSRIPILNRIIKVDILLKLEKESHGIYKELKAKIKKFKKLLPDIHKLQIKEREIE